MKRSNGQCVAPGVGRPNQLREYVSTTGPSAKALITDEVEGNDGDMFTAGKLGESTFGGDKSDRLGGRFRFPAENVHKFDF